MGHGRAMWAWGCGGSRVGRAAGGRRGGVSVEAGRREEDRRSLMSTLKRVHREEGARGMYKGLDAQLVKTVLAGALAMTIKEKSFSSALWMMLLLRGLNDEFA